MSEESKELLEPKTNRPPSEVGREIYRLLETHDKLEVELREGAYDIRVVSVEE